MVLFFSGLHVVIASKYSTQLCLCAHARIRTSRVKLESCAVSCNITGRAVVPTSGRTVHVEQFGHSRLGMPLFNALGGCSDAYHNLAGVRAELRRARPFAQRGTALLLIGKKTEARCGT